MEVGYSPIGFAVSRVILRTLVLALALCTVAISSIILIRYLVSPNLAIFFLEKGNVTFATIKNREDFWGKNYAVLVKTDDMLITSAVKFFSSSRIGTGWPDDRLWIASNAAKFADNKFDFDANAVLTGDITDGQYCRTYCSVHIAKARNENVYYVNVYGN